MKIFTADKQTGKTMALVRESAKTRAIIVVASYQMVQHVILLAKQLNLDIPEPITVTNYLKVLVYGGLNRDQKYLVDELQMMLSQMNVEFATVSTDYIDKLNAVGNIYTISPEDIEKASNE